MTRRSTRTVEARIEITRTHEGYEYDLYLEVEAEYDPGRPPPPCSNPSDPRYADPGEPHTIDIVQITVLECCRDEDSPEWLREGQLVPPGFELTPAEEDKVADLLHRAYDEPDYEPDGYDYDYGPDSEEAWLWH